MHLSAGTEMPKGERSIPVTMTKCRWRGLGGRVGLLVLTAALVPLPVAAADAAPGHATPAVKTSLRQAVVREAARAAVKTPMVAAPLSNPTAATWRWIPTHAETVSCRHS